MATVVDLNNSLNRAFTVPQTTNFSMREWWHFFTLTMAISIKSHQDSKLF